MTLQQLTDLLIEKISGGKLNEDFRHHPNEIMMRIQLAVPMLLRQQWFEDYKVGDGKIERGYIQVYENLEIKSSDHGSRKKLFVDLPSEWVALPGQRGIGNVYFSHTVSRSLEDYFMFRGDPASTIDLEATNKRFSGRHSYTVEGQRLVLDQEGINIKKHKITAELMVGVPSTIQPNDPLPLTRDIQEKVLVYLYNEYVPAAPSDKVLDDRDINSVN